MRKILFHTVMIGFALLLGSQANAQQTATKAAQETRTIDSQRVDGITIKPGYPLPVDAATLKDNLRLSRGIELFLWSIPMNQSYSGRDGMLEASGGGMLDVVYIGGFADHTVTLSTVNNETIYCAVHMDLHDGPVVYEQPAMDKKGYLFGSIIDVWQVALTDLGIRK